MCVFVRMLLIFVWRLKMNAIQTIMNGMGFLICIRTVPQIQTRFRRTKIYSKGCKSIGKCGQKGGLIFMWTYSCIQRYFFQYLNEVFPPFSIIYEKLHQIGTQNPFSITSITIFDNNVKSDYDFIPKRKLICLIG